MGRRQPRRRTAHPLQDLSARITEVPSAEIWVHWQSGYRAVIATSVLHAAGHVVVDVDDNFAGAREAGLVPGGTAAEMPA